MPSVHQQTRLAFIYMGIFVQYGQWNILVCLVAIGAI